MVLAFAKFVVKMMVGRCRPIILSWILHWKMSCHKMVIALAKFVVPLWTRKPRWADLQRKIHDEKRKYKWLLNYKLTFIVFVRRLQKYGLSSDQVELLVVGRLATLSSEIVARFCCAHVSVNFAVLLGFLQSLVSSICWPKFENPAATWPRK